MNVLAEFQWTLRDVWSYACADDQASYSSLLESIKIVSMETVSTGVLDRNKEHYLRSKDKAKKLYDISRHIQSHMSKYKKIRYTIHYVKPTA